MVKKLLVLKLLYSGIRTKDIETGEIISLKSRGIFKICEMDTITFDMKKEWTFGNQKYASGKIIDSKLINTNIKTEKISYKSDGIWNPYDSYGGEADEYFSDYINEGFRESFVLEDYSGYGFYKKDEDPVFEAVELKNQGDWEQAYKILTNLWEEYSECIDALVHLGHLLFDQEIFLNRAFNCYKVAADIVERSLSQDFDGIFLWLFLENRPYLRALHGLFLVLWRKKEFEKSYKIAKRLLRICPSDNLGVRFIIDKIQNHEEWKPE